jgi:hypothetical protein
MIEKPLKELLNGAYEAFYGSEELDRYTERHGIKSAGILTVTDDETAAMIAASLAPLIGGKTVVEIGGGIGLLALHMGMYAERVYCIEANPIWASCFISSLLVNKQKHVSYLFGSADEFEGQICGDVALFCTHSGLDSMKVAASKFAPVVFDVYGELIASNPDAFNKTAARLRKIA